VGVSKAFPEKDYADTIMLITVLVPGLVAYTEKGAMRVRIHVPHKDHIEEASVVSSANSPRIMALLPTEKIFI
jgi:hypothetical protein